VRRLSGCRLSVLDVLRWVSESPPPTWCRWPEVGEGWICEPIPPENGVTVAASVGMWVLVCFGVIAAAMCTVRRDLVAKVWEWWISAFRDTGKGVYLAPGEKLPE